LCVSNSASIAPDGVADVFDVGYSSAMLTLEQLYENHTATPPLWRRLELVELRQSERLPLPTRATANELGFEPRSFGAM
jgi:hypothetical protein